MPHPSLLNNLTIESFAKSCIYLTFSGFPIILTKLQTQYRPIYATENTEDDLQDLPLPVRTAPPRGQRYFRPGPRLLHAGPSRH